MKRKSIFSVVMAVMLMSMGSVANAQWSQRTACPGWNNPTSFSTGSQDFKYTGAGGPDSPKNAPNVNTCTTQANWSGISWNTSYTAGQMMTTTTPGCQTFSSLSPLPNHDRIFCIMDTNTQASVSGCPRNRDPNTKGTDGVYHLPFVPNREFNTYDTTGLIVNTTLSTSIRVGDDCAEGGNTGATALYYHIRPNSENALLMIYYAVVVTAPTHDVDCNPAFLIAVEHQNAAGNWVALSDTLVYAITIASNMPVESSYSINGWHNNNSTSSYDGVKFKDWTKVVLNLSNHLYENLRVHISISDCCASYHPAWAYIAGECREMDLTPSGCPAGMSTDVTVISAPRGMLRYEWSASEYGKSYPVTRLNQGHEDDYFTFRTLSMPEGTPHVGGQPAVGPEDTVYINGNRRDTVRYCDYHVRADDFHVLYRPNANKVPHIAASADSMGNVQVFRCRMTSALDPSKPFKTDLFINVTNTKPLMQIDTLAMCDGTVRLWNNSFVPGNPTLVVDSTTTWSFFNNEQAFGTPDTVIVGDSADYIAKNTNLKYVLVRTNTIDTCCYSEAIYPIRPIVSPRTGMMISQRVLCDSAQTTITDTTSDVVRRRWRFLSQAYDGPLQDLDFDNMPPGSLDVVEGNNAEQNSQTRPFFHSVEPIELTAWNGLYYLDRYNNLDTVWCNTVAHDTVAVFVHPELVVTGDNIVCEGSLTDAQVHTVGVDGCSYQWSMTYGYVSGDLPAGDRLQVVPYSDVSKYYIRVTSPQGCVAWDSAYAYYVRPQMEVIPPFGKICPGDTVWLIGTMADHYSWLAGSSLLGDADTMIVFPNSTTQYTMIGHGSNDCDAKPLKATVTVVPYPTPRVDISPNYVDSDDPTVVLTNNSPYGVTTQWRFSNGETATDRSQMHTFDEGYSGQDDSVYVELTTANELGCSVVYPFSIPVYLFTAWLPTVFTPGTEDINAKFKLFTINKYEYFHIYIYNREGMLVFESEDPAFEWDGTYKGVPCPQGAYVYVCNYRKPDAGTLSSRKGTITLLR